ncbi:MAG: DUF1501 domain-containing protein [Myxococcales bacterium]|nr:DUF1501 domain-containing protein [Myxococcales bacterium]
MTTRRQFLRGLGLTTGAALLPVGARADLTAGPDPVKILQIFLFRAPAHSQTLWMPEGGTFGDPVSERITAASGADHQVLADAADFDDLDHTVVLGDGLHPLESLGGVGRTHLVAMRSELGAHTLASAHALSGINIGNPAALSLGARVQAAWDDGGFPKSWVLDPQQNATLTSLATATGSQPASTRPFVLPVGRPFVSRLQRAHRSRADALLAYYREQYARRLEHATGPVRAPAFDVHDDAMARMAAWEQTYDVLHAGPEVESFSEGSYVDNGITKSVEMGVHLLHHGARHVTVIGGHNAAPDFDTHAIGDHETAHSSRHNGVLWGICEALRTAENFDVDNTLVVFHAEFGRFLDGSNGSEHWPDAYAALLFGGPVTQAGLTGRLFYQPDSNGILRSTTTEEQSITAPELLDGLAQLAGAPAPLGESAGVVPTPSGPIFQLG